MQMIERFITRNDYFTKPREIKVAGIMLHSIGCPQPNAEVIISNQNIPDLDKAIHGVIDGNTGVFYQMLPWSYRGGHCYKGKNGSGNRSYIGIEMCEPACIKYKKNSASFTCSDTAAARVVVERTYKSAVEVFAYLCKHHGLDPLADGVIISHEEAYMRGIASNHEDPAHLWRGLGMPYTMDTFRRDVHAEMAGAAPIKMISVSLPVLKKGSKGEAVKTLQRLLNAFECTDAKERKLDIDGSFGGATLYALKKFQDIEGLEVDGSCGAATWRALLT